MKPYQHICFPKIPGLPIMLIRGEALRREITTALHPGDYRRLRQHNQRHYWRVFGWPELSHRHKRRSWKRSLSQWRSW